MWSYHTRALRVDELVHKCRIGSFGFFSRRCLCVRLSTSSQTRQNTSTLPLVTDSGGARPCGNGTISHSSAIDFRFLSIQLSISRRPNPATGGTESCASRSPSSQSLSRWRLQRTPPPPPPRQVWLPSELCPAEQRPRCSVLVFRRGGFLLVTGSLLMNYNKVFIRSAQLQVVLWKEEDANFFRNLVEVFCLKKILKLLSKIEKIRKK